MIDFTSVDTEQLLRLAQNEVVGDGGICRDDAQSQLEMLSLLCKKLLWSWLRS